MQNQTGNLSVLKRQSINPRNSDVCLSGRVRQAIYNGHMYKCNTYKTTKTFYDFKNEKDDLIIPVRCMIFV